MYPLIEIKTIPIEIQMNIKDATLDYSRGTAEMEVSRTKGGLDIKSRPIRLRLDTFQARSSIFPTAMQSVDQAAEKGKQAAYEATATYARHGHLLLEAKVGKDVMTQFAREALEKNIKTNIGLTFLPTTGPDIQWEDGQMQIRYEMDKLNFDWKVGAGELKFTPGDIEISVEQMPDVIIKYIGGPIYVPPSAEPGYVPLDTQA